MKINKFPNYANDYEFVVCREIDGELWFWSAYSDGFKANKVAQEIGGVVIHNVRIQGKRNPTIGELKEMPNGDGWGNLPTIGEVEGWSGVDW